MKEAEWRPVPARAQEPARCGSATTPGVSLALLLTGALLSVSGRPMPGAFVVLVGLTLLASWLWTARRARLRERGKVRAEEATVKRELGVADAVLVAIQVRQGRAVTGEDQGAMWFEEGRLLFAGARTSFGLFAGDVAPGTLARLAESSRKEGSLRLPLDATTRVGRVSLVVRPLVSGSDPEMARTGYAVRSWLARSGAGEGQGPPLALASDAPSSSKLLLWAVGGTALWATMVPLAGLLAVFVAATCWGIPFLGLFLIGLATGFARYGRRFAPPWELWGAWADRRALEEA